MFVLCVSDHNALTPATQSHCWSYRQGLFATTIKINGLPVFRQRLSVSTQSEGLSGEKSCSGAAAQSDNAEALLYLSAIAKTQKSGWESLYHHQVCQYNRKVFLDFILPSNKGLDYFLSHVCCHLD